MIRRLFISTLAIGFVFSAALMLMIPSQTNGTAYLPPAQSIFLPYIPNRPNTATTTPTPTATIFSPFWTITPTITWTPTRTVTPIPPSCFPTQVQNWNFTCARGDVCRPVTDLGTMTAGQTLTLWVFLAEPDPLEFGFGGPGPDFVNLFVPAGDTVYAFSPGFVPEDVTYSWAVSGGPTQVSVQVTSQICTNSWPPGVASPTSTPTATPTVTATTIGN